MTTHHDHDHDSDGMFPRWPVTFDPPARRIVDPPQPVIVSINAALSVTSSTSFRDVIGIFGTGGLLCTHLANDGAGGRRLGPY